MHQTSAVWEGLILLVLLFLVRALGRSLKLPDSIAFILGGVLLATFGPQGFGVFRGESMVILMGEVGVGVILFEAGMEMSTDAIRRMLKPLLLGGATQIGLTTLIGAGAYYLIFGGGPAKALFVGMLLAPSSTPIILAKLRETGRLHAQLGTSTLGVLVAQDVSLLPFSILIPIMAGGDPSNHPDFVRIIAGLVGVGIVYGAEATTVGRLLDWCLKRHDRYLFLLTVIIVILGMANAAHAIGLSPILGVFLAGIMLSGSSHLADLLGHLHSWNFLGSMFFIATGFLLDFRFVGNPKNLPLLLISVVGTVTIKIGTGVATGLILGHDLRSSFRLAGYLAHIGEMAFLLILIGYPLGLLTGADKDAFFAITIATMLLSPLISRLIEAQCNRIDPGKPEESHIALHLNKNVELDGHVVVVGYGRVGQEVSKELKNGGIRVVVLELDMSLWNKARREKFEVVQGEARFYSVLAACGAETATAIVLTFAEVEPLASTIVQASRLNDRLAIYVRLRRADQVLELQRLIPNPEKVTTFVDEVYAAHPIATEILQRQAAAT